MALTFHDRHPEDKNLMGYAEFDLGDHNFKAWQPATDDASREFLIEVRKGDELVRTERVRMWHDNRFGVDIEDAASLERATDEIIDDLKLEG